MDVCNLLFVSNKTIILAQVCLETVARWSEQPAAKRLSVLRDFRSLVCRHHKMLLGDSKLQFDIGPLVSAICAEVVSYESPQNVREALKLCREMLVQFGVLLDEHANELFQVCMKVRACIYIIRD